MSRQSDFQEYDRLARPEMSREDLTSGDDLRDLIIDGEARAWWVYHPEHSEPIGWCSVMVPSPVGPDTETVHLLGNIVFGAHKRKGYGSAIVRRVVRCFDGHTFTAAIAPGNIGSVRAFSAAGFEPSSTKTDGPWRIWQRL